MSTRFPSHTVASVNKEMEFVPTDWRFLKPRLVDAIFFGMILLSVVGLTYAWLH